MTTADAIVFGALALHPDGGGVSTYARELLRALATPDPLSEPLQEFGAVSALVQRTAIAELPPGIRPIPVPASAGIRRAIRGKLPVGPTELFHSLDVDLPVSGFRSAVTTVHDMSVFDVPWAFSAVRARGERMLVSDALRRADTIIAVSEFTAERIQAISGRESIVTPLAPASWARPPSVTEVAAVRRKYRLPAEFVLQVGTVEPRKRTRLVAMAVRHLGLTCVLAGQGSTGPAAPPSAVGLGYVPASDLPALYGAATVVAYASEYEGFGLPPVEAMACGAPVVASAVGALPEVTGDGATLVRTHRVEDWIAALRPLVRDASARADLSERAVRAASALSWRATAEATAAAYGPARVAQ